MAGDRGVDVEEGTSTARRGYSSVVRLVGRAGDVAIAVLTLDTPLSEKDRREFEGLEAMHWARMARLRGAAADIAVFLPPGRVP